MKNEKKVRTYHGYFFSFESNTLMYKFIELYKDMFIDYNFIEWHDEVILHVKAGKGFIPEVRNGLGKMMVTKRHSRYFIKAA